MNPLQIVKVPPEIAREYGVEQTSINRALMEKKLTGRRTGEGRGSVWLVDTSTEEFRQVMDEIKKRSDKRKKRLSLRAKSSQENHSA